MTEDEILGCVDQAIQLGYGTVVIQSGEDHALTKDFISGLIRKIKAKGPLAITLSLGRRTDEEAAAWRQAGADRYLMRFETTNKALFARVHPTQTGGIEDRLDMLRTLQRLGYEVGSGMLIGLPGQSFDDLAADVLMLRELKLDMIGVGPYLVHPATPLADPKLRPGTDRPEDQVPADTLTACKVVALARLLCPRANIPSTTALATLDGEDGRRSGLARGANVVMPNLTPPEYRKLYEIYPGKATKIESADVFHQQIVAGIEAMGRTIGTGRGDSPAFCERTGCES